MDPSTVRRSRRILLALVASLCAVLAAVQPAGAAVAGSPHVVRQLAFNATAVTTNRLTHTTFFGDFLRSRVMTYDDTTGARTITGLPNACQCVGILASDDRTGKLFLAGGGEESGLYVLDEQTHGFSRVSQDGIWSFAVDQSRDIVYAGDAFKPVIHVIDGRTGRYIGVIHHGFAADLAFDPVRNLLYAVDQNVGDIVIRRDALANPFDVIAIDVATGRVVARLPEVAGAIDVEAAPGLIYAVDTQANIAVIDASSDRRLRTITVPDKVAAGDIALDPASNRLFVTGFTRCDFDCESLALALNPSTGALLWSHRQGLYGAGLSVDPDRRLVFIGGEYHVDVVAD